MLNTLNVVDGQMEKEEDELVLQAPRPQTLLGGHPFLCSYLQQWGIGEATRYSVLVSWGLAVSCSGSGRTNRDSVVY